MAGIIWFQNQNQGLGSCGDLIFKDLKGLIEKRINPIETRWRARQSDRITDTSGTVGQIIGENPSWVFAVGRTSLENKLIFASK